MGIAKSMLSLSLHSTITRTGGSHYTGMFLSMFSFVNCGQTREITTVLTVEIVWISNRNLHIFLSSQWNCLQKSLVLDLFEKINQTIFFYQISTCKHFKFVKNALLHIKFFNLHWCMKKGKKQRLLMHVHECLKQILVLLTNF